MRKSLGIVLAVLLVAAMSVPAMGATLSVSGKYVGAVTYDGGVIKSVNDPGITVDGVNLAALSTLYLTIDFAEGETMSAHIPLMFYMDRAQREEKDENENTVLVDVNVLSVDQADTYLVVYKGTPFTLSLTDGTEGDYAFASFGDPLGLVKYIKTEVDPITSLPTHTLKVTGAPFGIGFTGYAITQDNTDDEGRTDVNPRYAFGRATYELPGGYTVGAIAAGKGSDGGDAIANVEADVTGPLPISEGAKFTAAVAGALEKPDNGDWSNAAPAFELNLSGIALGNFSFSGNVRAVSPDFTAVAPGPSSSPSDVNTYKNWRQVQGEVSTSVDLKGQAIKLTLGDDFRTRYDGSMDDNQNRRAYNKVYGSAEFSPIEPLKVTVGGYYQDYLTKVAPIADDNRKNVYGKVEYTPFDYLTVSGGVQWMGANIDNNSGSGFLVEASAEATPIEGVSVTASTSYESGGYDFIDNGTVVDNHTRLDYEVYAEAKQTFVPGGVKQVDTTLAGLARGSYVGMTGDAGTTYVAYADANIALNDAFSNRLALVTGNTTEDTGTYEASQHDYATLVYDKLTWTLSPNSTLSVAYTYNATNSKGSFSGSYKVTLGASTVTLSYGKSGLSWYSCFDDFDDEKPWAWLCNASVNPNPDYFKLSVSIPF